MKRIDVDQSFPAFMSRGVVRVACAAAFASVIGLATFPSSAAETDWSKVAARAWQIRRGHAGRGLSGGHAAHRSACHA